VDLLRIRSGGKVRYCISQGEGEALDFVSEREILEFDFWQEIRT